MLTHRPLVAFIPTKDTTRAQHFYEDILGLRFVSDDSFAIVMDANGTMVRIVRVEQRENRARVPKDAARHRSRIACLSRAPGVLPPPRPAPTSRKIG